MTKIKNIYEKIKYFYCKNQLAINIILTVIFIIISFLLSLNLKDKNYDDSENNLLLNMWIVEGTVTVLSVAIISLLTSVFNNTYFGFSFREQLGKQKISFLNYWWIIIISFFLFILNLSFHKNFYLFLIVYYLNLLFILIALEYTIFILFHEDSLLIKLRKWIKNNINNDVIFTKLYSDTIENLNNNYITKFNRNLILLKEIIYEKNLLSTNNIFKSYIYICQLLLQKNKSLFINEINSNSLNKELTYELLKLLVVSSEDYKSNKDFRIISNGIEIYQFELFLIEDKIYNRN